MVFKAPHHDYTEAEMDRFDTGNSSHPALFVSHDRLCVFVQEDIKQSPFKVRLADDDEIQSLWELHHFVALLSVLSRRSRKSPEQ